MYDITISTNGACSGNPGRGGWAAILRCGEKTKEICGSDPQTTNNRMELKAVIEAVRILKAPCNITVRTDSQYICNGMANARERSRNGWRTKTGARCAHSDLWKELTDLGIAGKHRFHYEYVDGQSGDADNKKSNQMAREQARR